MAFCPEGNDLVLCTGSDLFWATNLTCLSPVMSFPYVFPFSSLGALPTTLLWCTR